MEDISAKRTLPADLDERIEKISGDLRNGLIDREEFYLKARDLLGANHPSIYALRVDDDHIDELVKILKKKDVD